MNQPPIDNSTPDLTGQTIGEYYLIRRLGRGGMADVYLSQQQSLKRNVALKILKPELARDNSYIQRFLREAQAAAGLVQANIVQIYEVGQDNGVHFIAQEYVPGRNLRQYISRYGAVEPVMAVNVLRQVALALQKADEMNVIHRDIKPENIMISTTGEVKVADFGLARVNNERARQDLTQIGITMGTPLYMSPEQVEGQKIDPRSDIYSLGVTAYHMLTGRPPYEGENALAIALQHVNTEPQPLAEIRPDVPVELCQLVHKMIAKSPDDRPADAAFLIKEIRKIKIDVDEDWEELIEKLAATESMGTAGSQTVPESKLAVTRQLEAVMKGNIQSWWKSPSTMLLLASLILLGLALGTWNAFGNPPVDPFDVEGRILSSIVKENNVREQYRMAYWFNTEDHWKAVIEYFPINEAEDENNMLYYHREANARLGEFYLKHQDWDNAHEIYDKLRNIEDINERFNVIGWAGLAIVYNQRNSEDTREQLALVRNALALVENKRDKLNRFLRDQIDELLILYGQKNALTLILPNGI